TKAGFIARLFLSFRPRATRWLWLLLLPFLARRIAARSEMALDFQATRHCLVVLWETTASLDVRFDLEATRHRLVVVVSESASLYVRFHLQPTRHRLVVVRTDSASLDVRLDFHTSSPVQNCCLSKTTNAAPSAPMSAFVTSRRVRRERMGKM